MRARSRRGSVIIFGISMALVWTMLDRPLSAQFPQFESIAAVFNQSAPPAYRAHRRLEGGLVGSDRHGWMEVLTEFSPGRGLTFEVISEGGSEYIRKKVLRNLLENEQELLAQGKALRAGLNADNYAFADGGLTPAGHRRILLTPQRKSIGIVKGTVVIDPERGSVMSLQGRLVKSPSFWVRDVDVTWKFATIAGHFMPIEMISDGRVRIFGKSNFRMTYDYLQINGARVDGSALRASTGGQEN